MKTAEEMMEYFRSMPKKKTESNPYWEFDDESKHINAVLYNKKIYKLFDLEESKSTLQKVREFFRRYYESFHSEAQVLCVIPKDGEKLASIGVPVLTQGQIGPFEVTVMVLPQDNHAGTSVISEWFWQYRIINAGIKPVVRIHSHHILDPYQSMTDYSTLNSGTLEMVIGRIDKEELYVCYWLDVPGTDNKSYTCIACENKLGDFVYRQHQFHKQQITGIKLDDAVMISNSSIM